MAHAIGAERSSSVRLGNVAVGHGAPAGRLRISLFGRVHIAHDRIALETGPTRAVQNLLAYLLLHRHRTHSRESLLGMFWGDHDEESARNCLNTTLWRLRRVLEPPGVPRGTYLTTTSGGEVGFNDQSPYWLDVEELERRAGIVRNMGQGPLAESDVKGLEEAVSLYTGDILDGVYDDWALRERERLRALYLKSLACLMRYHAKYGSPERGITHAEELLRHDPLREEIHRELMRLHLVTGARASAARQYETCKRLLAEELGVEPMSETQALLTVVKSGTGLSRGSAVGEPSNIDTLTHELRGAKQNVERALKYLCEVMTRVEQALVSSPRR